MLAWFVDNLVVVIGILIECRRAMMFLRFIIDSFAFSQGKQFREIHTEFHKIEERENNVTKDEPANVVVLVHLVA